MVYDRENRSLIGEILPHNFRLTLNLPDLSLTLLKNDSVIYPTVPLAGLTRQEAFTELSHLLEDVGINIDNLKNELHYDFPDHDLVSGSTFKYDHPAQIDSPRSKLRGTEARRSQSSINILLYLCSLRGCLKRGSLTFFLRDTFS